MKAAILSLAAILTLSATVLAGTPSGKSGGSPSPHNNNHVSSKFVEHHDNHFVAESFKFKDYHLTHGVKFDFGYIYKGFDHNHWSKIYFSNFYGCRIYHCPYTLVEYYWCAWDNCYYPVTYKPYGRFVF
jgi:hypothetical protein